MISHSDINDPACISPHPHRHLRFLITMLLLSTRTKWHENWNIYQITQFIHAYTQWNSHTHTQARIHLDVQNDVASQTMRGEEKWNKNPCFCLSWQHEAVKKELKDAQTRILELEARLAQYNNRWSVASNSSALIKRDRNLHAARKPGIWQARVFGSSRLRKIAPSSGRGLIIKSRIKG